MRYPKISPRVFEWLALLSILLIGAFLRFYQLEYKSLWIDEIGQVVAAQGGVMGAMAGAAQHVAAPPLDYLVTGLLLQIGSSEFVLRFAPAAWSILAIALLFVLTKQLIGSTCIALTAAYLFALAPLVVRYAQEVRFYSLSLTLTLLCVYAFVRAWEHPTRARWLWFALAAVAAFYTHYYIGLILAALVVWALGSRANRTRARVLGLTASLAFIALAALPWLVLAGRGDPTSFVFSPPTIGDVLSDPVVGVNIDPDWRGALDGLGLVVLPLLALIGLVSLWRTRRTFFVLITLLLFVGVAGVLGGDYFLSYFYTPRQLVFLVPFYLILVAAGIVALASVVRRWSFVVRLGVAGAILTVITLLSLVSLRGYYDWVKDDWRSAAQLLRNANAQSIHGEPVTLGTYLAYYQPSLQSALGYGATERYWIVALDSRRPIGLGGMNSIHLDASPTLNVLYVGRASEDELWREVAAFDLPPQVVAYSDVLDRVQAFDPALAQQLATRARLAAQTANPPLLDSQQRRLQRKLRPFQ